jgi:riboflavin synthase
MFTGIVTDIGEVLSVKARADDLHRLKIACGYPRAGILDGASIACSGACLTVVGAGEEDGRTWFAADVGAETLRLTTAGGWRHGTRLNLERALKIGDELGGHIVAGHADGIAKILKRDDLPDMARFELSTTRELARFIAPKGSVAVDGVSLTVNEVSRSGFSVNIIPHTLACTNFAKARPGQRMNLEIDLIARYVAKLLGPRVSGTP